MAEHANDLTKRAVVEHYTKHAPAMQGFAYFYDWVTEVVQKYVPNRDARVCDVGCGTGVLLSRLRELGYSGLHGVDFSPGCVALAHAAVPEVPVAQRDIEEGPLDSAYDLLLLTTVLDFLAEPDVALRHMRRLLNPNGLILLTIRNRDAYWPLYHARHFAKRFQNRPRLHHWFLWFTTPLGMRRNDQPYEQVFSVGEARQLLRDCGLTPIAEEGMMMLPMSMDFRTVEINDQHPLAGSCNPESARQTPFLSIYVCLSKHCTRAKRVTSEFGVTSARRTPYICQKVGSV